MNYYENLNTLIDTIEKELEDEIDYSKLAKIIGTSAYTMQRIFVFLTRYDTNRVHKKKKIKQSSRGTEKDKP